MKSLLQNPLVFCGLVLFIAICGIALLATREKHSFVTTSTQWISTHLEGFSPQQLTVPQCPPDSIDSKGNKVSYTFYTDSAGESMCCSGPVNSLSHTCTPADSQSLYGICAFRTGVPDPIRGGTATLPLCGMVAEMTNKTQASTLCPPSLPNYASGRIGVNKGLIQSCCKNGPNNDGTNCSSIDLQNGNFCRVGTKQQPSDKDCATLQQFDNAQCPPNLQKTLYTMGSVETAAYPKAANLQVPLCFGVEHTCYPDNVVDTLQKQNVFTKEPANPKNWAFACSGYTSQYVDKLANPDFKSTYLS